MKRILLYVLFGVNLAAILFIWWLGSGPLVVSGNEPEILIAFGRLFGLLAEFFILFQIVLMGRIRWIEKQFGHDKMNVLHQWVGTCILCVLPFHPIFLIVGYAQVNNVSLWSQFLTFIFTWHDVLYAFIGFVILFGAMFFSWSIIRNRLKYEQWHFTHLFVYAAILFFFWHQTNFADVSTGWPLYYWLVLNGCVFGLIILYRFLRPLWLFWRQRFYIDRMEKETDDVTSVYIKGRKMGEFKYDAGQFVNVMFLARGLWTQHPFSLSTAPNGQYLRLSIKASGDFTSKVSNLKPGTKVIIDGPLGKFTEELSHKDKYLFVAGGIGITPIRALIESLSAKGKDIVLLYGNRNAKDIAFEKELDTFAHRRHVVLSEVVDPGFEQGYIDTEKITRLAPDFLEREVFVCGPPVMMSKVIAILKDLGVPNSQIHFERFGY